jgi:hypothetical protein
MDSNDVFEHSSLSKIERWTKVAVHLDHQALSSKNHTIKQSKLDERAGSKTKQSH